MELIPNKRTVELTQLEASAIDMLVDAAWKAGNIRSHETGLVVEALREKLKAAFTMANAKEAM